MSEPSESEKAGSIRARFMVTKSNVTILADFKGISITIAWKRAGDPEGDARHLRTLVGNLPEVIRDGLQEIYVSDQAKRIDFELEELFNEENRDGSSTEEFGPGPLDARTDPEDGRGSE